MQPARSSTTSSRAPSAFDLFIAPVSEQKRRVAGLIGALLLLSIAQGLFLFLVGPFLRVFFTDTASTIPLSSIIPHAMARHLPWLPDTEVPRALLTSTVPALIILAGVIKALATYLYHLNQESLALWVAKRYRDRLFSAILHLPYTDIRRRGAGEWMSLVMNDVILLQERYTEIMTAVVRDGVLVVACYCAMIAIHWPTALVLLAITPLVGFLLGRAARRIAWFAEAFQRELGRLAGALLDMRERFDFLRSQRGETIERARFGRLNTGYYRVLRRSIMVRSALGPSLELVGFSLFAFFVWAISAGWLGPDAAPGATGTRHASEVVVQFFAALGFLLRPLRNLGEQLTKLQETVGALRRSVQTFDSVERAARRAAEALPALPTPSSGPWSGLTIQSIQSGFDGRVTFAGQSLSIPRGRAIAIIGPSGSGKSTFVKSLAGLVMPDQWDASLSWPDTASRATLVSQEPFLFDDTLRANLTYGLDPTRLPTDADIETALATVNVLDEIRALPDGLMTRVRAIGSNFSGGQIQRLVIARALLRQRDLWLLDEATSAVDARSERDITTRLIAAAHRDGNSLVMVTHRLRWLESFDDVWFIENGRVALAGPHHTIMRDPALGDRYQRFCSASPVEATP